MTQNNSSMINSGRRIAMLLAAKDMTQSSLAKYLDQSTASISRKISGALKFSSTDYMAMADLFDVSIDALMAREPMEVK